MSTSLPNANVFVTQIHEREDESGLSNPAGQNTLNSNTLLQTGLNTLQQTLIVKKESEMAKLDKDLSLKRHEFELRMEECAKRKLELQRRQQNIMSQVEKFDQFIKENEVKRKRALQKYQLENKLKKSKEEELEKLKFTLSEIKDKHEILLSKVKEYKKYEEYMVKVINSLPPDYLKASDNPLTGLMMRHKTLFETNNDLLLQMDSKLDEIKTLRHKLDGLKQEHSRRLLEMNSRLSELHHEQERVQGESQRVEQIFRYGQRDMRDQVEKFGLTIRAIDNITEKCLKKVDSSETSSDKRDNLSKIEEYIQDMQEILKIVESNDFAIKKK